MQPVINASREECPEVSIRRHEHEGPGGRPFEDLLIRRVMQTDVSDMHRLVTRLAQELGEHRRQGVVDE
jgi:hypothetical protein